MQLVVPSIIYYREKEEDDEDDDDDHSAFQLQDRLVILVAAVERMIEHKIREVEGNRNSTHQLTSCRRRQTDAPRRELLEAASQQVRLWGGKGKMKYCIAAK